MVASRSRLLRCGRVARHVGRPNGAATVLTHSIHIHDLLTYIGGPLSEVRAMTATRVNDIETEDCAVAVGRTVDGALVTMNVTVGAATQSPAGSCGVSRT